MKVILLKDIENFGKAGEVVDVKDGYGRNYLIPKGIAIEANEENLANWKEDKKAREEEERVAIEEANKIKEKLEAASVTLKAKVGEEGKLFGSITSQDIQKEIKEQLDIYVDRKKIELDDNIKEVGEKIVPIRIYVGVVAELKVIVEAK